MRHDWLKQPGTLAMLTYTNAKGQECERIAPRIRFRGTGKKRGWNWYQPFDKLNKCFLAAPYGDKDWMGNWIVGGHCPTGSKHTRFGSYVQGVVWNWLRATSVEWHEEHTSAKAAARWQKVLERRKIRAVERRLDGDAA